MFPAMSGGAASFRELGVACDWRQVGQSVVTIGKWRWSGDGKNILSSWRPGREQSCKVPWGLGKPLGASACFCQGWHLNNKFALWGEIEIESGMAQWCSGLIGERSASLHACLTIAFVAFLGASHVSKMPQIKPKADSRWKTIFGLS